MTGMESQDTGIQEVGRRGVFAATVVANDPVCPEHYVIQLEMAGFGACAPGQFVNIGPAVGDMGATFQPARPLLKRPFSIYARQDQPNGKVRIALLYRVLGCGTQWIGSLRVGDTAQVIGPLGQGFAVPDDLDMALMVAGGTGVAPLVYLARQLRQARPAVRVILFEGVRSRSLLPFQTDLAAPCPDPRVLSSEIPDVPILVATDDGSAGLAGTVVQALERWLEANGSAGAEAQVFSCGPEVMMAALAEVCQRHQVRCQVSLEKSMACGMGTCQSCVTKVKDGQDPEGWVYKLCCKDGPVFDASQVVW